MKIVIDFFFNIIIISFTVLLFIPIHFFIALSISSYSMSLSSNGLSLTYHWFVFFDYLFISFPICLFNPWSPGGSFLVQKISTKSTIPGFWGLKFFLISILLTFTNVIIFIMTGRWSDVVTEPSLIDILQKAFLLAALCWVFPVSLP